MNRDQNNLKIDQSFDDKKLMIKNSIGDDDDDTSPKYQSSYTPDPKSKTPVIDQFSKDLSRMAEENKIDPVVGRNEEVTRVCEILSRRKKNNPILLGEPGCVDGDTIITIRKISNDTIHENIEIDY